MDKINKVLEKLLAFVDKNSTIVIVLVVVAFGAKYFTDLFSFIGGINSDKQKNQEAHNDVLVSASKVVPAKTGNKVVDAKVRNPILRANVKVASAKFDATVAEEIRKYTKLIPDNPLALLWNNHEYQLVEIAKQIAKYKGDIKNIAAEYKKAFNDDLYADVRSVLGSYYPTWLSIATKK